MSDAPAPKLTLTRLAEMKSSGDAVVMVTAYDYPVARAAAAAGVDVILVGDSGAQVMLGYESTGQVSIDEMLMMAKAVRRGAPDTFVLCDVPFGSTEISDEQAVETALRFVREAGADAVKIEGGGPARLSRIRAIVAAGVPVVGHLGLTPQTATMLGGFRAQGRTEQSARRLVTEALAVEAAGACAMVVEAVPTEVFAEVHPAISVPVIGIGAGPADGQVLVVHDLLGITQGRAPVFVKRFGAIGAAMSDALATYAAEVRSGEFPAAEHQYRATPEAVDAARRAVAELRSDA